MDIFATTSDKLWICGVLILFGIFMMNYGWEARAKFDNYEQSDEHLAGKGCFYIVIACAGMWFLLSFF